MSAFEDFVQVELPKRPYLNTDAAQETIVVRRGVGPRQLSAITLADGELLTMVAGVLTPLSIQSILSTFGGGIRRFVLTVPVATSTWVVTHNLNSENVIVQAFDENKFVIIPDSIQIVSANVVELKFNTPQVGVARVVFLD